MEMPIEIVERLNTCPKMIADVKMGLGELRRSDAKTRIQWWNAIEAAEAEVNTLSCRRNKYLDANVALAKLKLVVAFVDNGEPAPNGHGFNDGEIEMLRGLEEMAVFDPLPMRKIIDCIQRGDNCATGLMTAACLAASRGYDRLDETIANTISRVDLAFAFQIKHRERISKIKTAAAEYLLKYGSGEVGRVTATEAKLLEGSYVALVESRLRDPQGDLKWRKIESLNDLEKIHTELSQVKSVSPAEVRDKLPNGLGVRAVNDEGTLFLKRRVLGLEAKVLARCEQLLLKGFDSQGLSIDAIAPHIEDTRRRAKRHLRVLALASPTGWSEDAVEKVGKGEIASPNVLLVLVDLGRKAMHYDRTNRKLNQVLYYIDPKLDEVRR